DEDQNSVPEETAYLRLDATATDADSNGVVGKVDLSFRAERMRDPNQDGTPDTHEWSAVERHAEDRHRDGAMDNQNLLIENDSEPTANQRSYRRLRWAVTSLWSTSVSR